MEENKNEKSVEETLEKIIREKKERNEILKKILKEMNKDHLQNDDGTFSDREGEES